MMRRQWTGNDNTFGPFAIGKNRKKDGWNPVGVTLESGDDDDRCGCVLRVHSYWWTISIDMPSWVLRPWRRKVIATTWNAETVARMGRDWYWEVNPREYGFYYSDKTLHLHYGPQTFDSSTTKSKCYFIPWLDWTFIRHSFYDLDQRS